MNEDREAPGGTVAKRVLLHIGMHKTGTTAIQLHLASRRAGLASAGVHYPLDLRAGAPYSEAHHYIPFYFLGYESYNDALGYPGNYAAGLRERIETDQAGCLLFSSENFSSLKRDEIAALGRILDGFDVRVIVYLRRQDDFLQAMYQTDVVNAYFPSQGPIDAYEAKSPLDFAELCGQWAAIFGKKNLVVRVYEEGQLTGGDAVKDFIHVLAGLGYAIGDPDFSGGTINPSLPAHFVETVRRIALRAPRSKPLWEAARKTGRRLYRKKNPHLWFMSPGQRRALLDRYADSNRRVAIEYLEREDGKLFNDLAVPWNDEEWAEFYGNDSALFARFLDDVAERIDGLEKENAGLRQMAARLREEMSTPKTSSGIEKFAEETRRKIIRIPFFGRILWRTMRAVLRRFTGA